MIQLSKLKFGDKIYVVDETNNSFIRKKTKMIDVNGIEWYRYDKDRWEYSIKEIFYCGKVTHIEEGEVRFDEERETEYHFKYPDGQIHPEYDYEDNYDLSYWFLTRKEAEKFIAKKKIEREGE